MCDSRGETSGSFTRRKRWGRAEALQARRERQQRSERSTEDRVEYRAGVDVVVGVLPAK